MRRERRPAAVEASRIKGATSGALVSTLEAGSARPRLARRFDAMGNYSPYRPQESGTSRNVANAARCCSRRSAEAGDGVARRERKSRLRLPGGVWHADAVRPGQEWTAAAKLRPRAAGQRIGQQTGIARGDSELTCARDRKATRCSRSAGWVGSETRRGLAAPGFCNAAMRSCSARWCPCRRGAFPSLRVGLATPESYLTAGRAGAGGARQRLRR